MIKQRTLNVYRARIAADISSSMYDNLLRTLWSRTYTAWQRYRDTTICIINNAYLSGISSRLFVIDRNLVITATFLSPAFGRKSLRENAIGTNSGLAAIIISDGDIHFDVSSNSLRIPRVARNDISPPSISGNYRRRIAFIAYYGPFTTCSIILNADIANVCFEANPLWHQFACRDASRKFWLLDYEIYTLTYTINLFLFAVHTQVFVYFIVYY